MTVSPPTAGLVLGLGADTNLSVNNSNVVTQWGDEATGTNWISGVVGSPTLTTVNFGNGPHSVIHFGGTQANGNQIPDSGDGLTLLNGNSLNLSSLSVYVVGDVNAEAQGQDFIANYDNNGGANYGWALGAADGNPQQVKFFTAAGGDSLSGTTGNQLSAGQYYVIGGSYQANGSSGTKAAYTSPDAATITTSNPASDGSAPAISYGTGNALTASLGYLHSVDNPFTQQFLTGNIAEVLVYDDTGLSAGQIAAQDTAVNAYLATKYFSSNVNLTITSTHSSNNGSFADGDMVDSNDRYALTVTNSGSGPTTAPITVNDTLPAGVTLSGPPLGDGWTTSAAAGASSFTAVYNGPALAAGSSAVLTVPVVVAPNAPTGNANTATVSGGGETVAAGTFSDPTDIRQLTVYSVQADFSDTQNPNPNHGGAWSYGSYLTSNAFASDNGNNLASFNPGTGSASYYFVPFPSAVSVPVSNGQSVVVWRNNGNTDPNVIHNPTANGDLQLGGIDWQPGLVTLSPYAGSAVVRWTAPATGYYGIAGSFERDQTSNTSGTAYVLLSTPATSSNGVTQNSNAATQVLWSQSVNPAASNLVPQAITGTNSVLIQAGQSIDFVVAGGSATTALAASIIPLSALTVSSTHSGSFIQGDTSNANDQYTLTVSNSSASSTSGTVTLTDSLPIGLTPVAASGNGWSITTSGQTVTATRSDALAAGGAYPALTMAVSVAGIAPASVVNAGTVTGGGLMASTITFADTTTIAHLPSTFASDVINDGALAFWPLNEANTQNGATAVSLVNPGTYNGAYQSGNQAGDGVTSGPAAYPALGTAAYFHNTLANASLATSDAVITPNIGLPSGSADRTILFWAKDNLTSADSYYHAATDYGTPGTLTTDVGTAVFSSSDGNSPTGGLAISQWGDGSGTTTPFTDAQWHFFAVTVSGGGATPTYQVYADGVLQNSKAMATNTVLGLANTIGAAASQDPSGTHILGWNGGLSDVAIFGSALSSTQIANLYADAPNGAVLSVTSSHSNQFRQNDTAAAGDSYTLSVTNSGNGATSGPVTFVDTLPSGLTATSASGNGWSITTSGQTVTATRSDALAAGGAYPALTITVSVAGTAPASVINTGTVSGGGVIASVGTFADATTITHLPSTFASDVINDGALAFWPLNEANTQNGATAVSLVNPGTYNGAYQAGNQAGDGVTSGPAAYPTLGTAAYFHNTLANASLTTSDAVITPNVGLPAGSADRTIMFWAKDNLTSADSYYHAATDYGTPGTLTTDVGTAVFSSSDGNSPTGGLAVSQWGDGSGTTTPFTDGHWHFFAVTVSGGGATPTYQVYADGVLQNSKAMATNTVLGLANTIGAAASQDPSGTHILGWNGGLSDVAIFGSALSSTQIANLYADAPNGAALSVHMSTVSTLHRGDTSDQYLLTVSNTGTQSTSGTITLSDTLASGLTPTAANGSGWTASISGQTIVATYNGTLAAGQSLPGLTVSVNVAANAAANVMSSGTLVSGDGTAPTAAFSDNLVVLVPPRSLAQDVVADGALAFWPLNDVSTANGATAVSVTNPGVYNGVYQDNVTSGPAAFAALGTAAYFHNTSANTSLAASDAVITPNIGLPTGTADRTVLFWAKDSNMSADTFYHAATEYGSPGTFTSSFGTFVFAGADSNAPVGGMGVSQWGDGTGTTTAFTDGQWHFFAVTVSGGTSTPTYKVYADGILQNSKAITTNTILGLANTIGSSASVDGAGIVGWNGGLGDVAIFGTALNLGQIDQLYLDSGNGAVQLVHTDLEGTASHDTSLPNPGLAVSGLVGGITTPDPNSAKGIAIVGTDQAHGTIQYSTDGGTSWQNVGTVSTSNALMLPADSNTRVRLVSTDGYVGTVSDAITFRAWDQSIGTADTRFDIAAAGAGLGFSTATDAVQIQVTSPLILNISGPATVTVGSTYTLNLSATETGGNTISGWTINWGDGTSGNPDLQTVAGDPSSVSHTYSSVSTSSPLQITATATDQSGTYSAGSQQVSVVPAPPFVVGPDEIIANNVGAQSYSGWATAIGPISSGGHNPSFVVTNDNNSLFAAQPSVAADGTLSFTPASGASGTATVSVLLTGQDANGNAESSATQSFAITILGLRTGGLPNFSLAVGDSNPVIPLWRAFSDPTQPSSTLQYSIVGNTNPSLFSAVDLNSQINSLAGTLTLPLAYQVIGSSNITLQAQDSAGATVQTTFTVTVGSNYFSTTTPTTMSLSVVNGTTTGGSIATTDPTLSGTITGPSDVAYQEVQFRYNSDSQVDATVLTDGSGNFTYTPVGLPTGYNTVSARAEFRGASGLPNYGPWTSISFQLNPVAGAALPDVTSLKLANDTGASNTDLSTSDPGLLGQLSSNADYTVHIQFDTNSDGVPDESVDAHYGSFYYSPGNLPQGQVTIRARTAIIDSSSGTPVVTQTGNWFSFSFVYSSTPDSTAAQSQAAAVTKRAALLAQVGQVATQQQSASSNSLTAANDSAAQAYHQAVDGGKATHDTIVNTSNANYSTALANATAAYNSSVSAAQSQFTASATAAGNDPSVSLPADFTWGNSPSLDPTASGGPAAPQPGSNGPAGLTAPTFTGPAISFGGDTNYSSSLTAAYNNYYTAVDAALSHTNSIEVPGTSQSAPSGTAYDAYGAVVVPAWTAYQNATYADSLAYQAALAQSPPAALDLTAAWTAYRATINLALQDFSNVNNAAYARQLAADQAARATYADYTINSQYLLSLAIDHDARQFTNDSDAAQLEYTQASDAAYLGYQQTSEANAAWVASNQATATMVRMIADADAAKAQALTLDAAQATLQIAINDATAMQTVAIANALDVKSKAIDAATLAGTIVWAATQNTPWSDYQVALAQAQKTHDDNIADALAAHDVATALAIDVDADAQATATAAQNDANATAQDALTTAQQQAIANFMTGGVTYSGTGVALGQIGLAQQFHLAGDLAYATESDSRAVAQAQYADDYAQAYQTEQDQVAQNYHDYNAQSIGYDAWQAANRAANVVYTVDSKNADLSLWTKDTIAGQTYQLSVHASEAFELNSEAALAKTAQITQATASADYQLAFSTAADNRQLAATTANLAFDDAQSTANANQATGGDDAEAALTIAKAQPQATFDSATMTAYVGALNSWAQTENTPWATYFAQSASDQKTLLAALDSDSVTNITANTAADTSDNETAITDDSQFMHTQDAKGLTLAQAVMGADLTRAQSLHDGQVTQASALAQAQFNNQVAVVAANLSLQDTIAKQTKILDDKADQAQATYDNTVTQDNNSGDANYQTENANALATFNATSAQAQQAEAQNLADARLTWNVATSGYQVTLVAAQGTANVAFAQTQHDADVAFEVSESPAVQSYDDSVAGALATDDEAKNAADDTDVHSDDAADNAQAHSDAAAIAANQVAVQNDLNIYLTTTADQYAATVATWAAGQTAATQAANQANFLSAVASAAATWQQNIDPILHTDAAGDAGANQTEADHDADAAAALFNSVADAALQLAGATGQDAVSAIDKLDAANAASAVANATATANNNLAIAQALATENTAVAQAQANYQVAASQADEAYTYGVAAANTVYAESANGQSDWNTQQSAIAAAAGSRTSADQTANVSRVQALGTAQVTDAQSLATANLALVTAQQNAQATLVAKTASATDSQADSDAGAEDAAIETIDGAGVTFAGKIASDGSTWATTTENADDNADESVVGNDDTLTVAIAQAAANYNVAQAQSSANAAAATDSAMPSAANLFGAQYAQAAYQWTQLVAPQFVSLVQIDADVAKQHEINNDEANKTLLDQLAGDESTFESTTAANDAADATTDGEAAIKELRATTHNDDAYAASTAQANANLAITTAGAQGTDGVAIAQADANEQLEVAQAGLNSPTTAMLAEYNTAVENTRLTLVTTQANADVTWTNAYTTAGVADGEGDTAADAQAARSIVAADAADVGQDADAAKTANDQDAQSIFGFAQTTLTDSVTDANSQISAQDTFWGQIAQDTVTVAGNLNTTVGSPLTQYLVARAGAESTWTTSLVSQFNNYSNTVLTAKTGAASQDIQAAKVDAIADDAAIATAIHTITGDLLANANTDIGAMLGHAGSLASPINSYGSRVATARSQDTTAVAQAKHDLNLGGSQSVYQAALATAAQNLSSALSAAAVDYALSEIGPQANATRAIAGSDLSATDAVDAALENLQTTVDGNDLSNNLLFDNNAHNTALIDASATKVFEQNTSTSFDTALDGLATSDPSPYSTQGAALADAQNAQAQSGAVAQYNQAVATTNAAWTLATSTDNATVAVNDAQALAGQMSGDASAQAAYNLLLGQLASQQATVAGGGIAALLPAIATPLGITTSATLFAEVAVIGRPTQDNFNNIGLGSQPITFFGGQNSVPTASYYGQSQLSEGLQLGTTIYAVEHPSVSAAPSADNALSVVSQIANSPAQGVVRCAVEFVQGGLLNGQPASVQMVEMCFPAGTPVRVRDAAGGESWRPIETLLMGEEVWSTPDNDPNAPGEWKTIERVFHNPPARVMNVHAGDGQVIRCTHAHRFWVVNRGWIPAEKLMVGDNLLGPTCELVPVTDVFDNGEIEPVYNLRVADNHTYFVATPDRKRAVLVHNDYASPTGAFFGSLWNGLKSAAEGIKGIGTGETGAAIGERAFQITEQNNGGKFNGQWGQVGYNIAGQIAGTHSIAEGSVGVDLATHQELDNWERSTRVAGGVGQYAGLAAGGAAAVRGATGATFTRLPGSGAVSRATGALQNGAARVLGQRAASTTKAAAYGDLADELRGTGQQANHLNQNAVYKGIIPEDEGLANSLRGNAFTDTGSPHYVFHKSLESFWNQFRKGGARFGETPTNAEYSQALQQALRAGGVSSAEAADLIAQAASQRAAYGLLEDAPVPRIPGRLPQKNP